MTALFSPTKLRQTSDRIRFYRGEWDSDLPLKIHAYGVDDGHGLGGPPFHPEFEDWLGPICFCGRPKNETTGDAGCPSNRPPRTSKKLKTHGRHRTTRAFRRLRKVAPREFDALYLMVALKASFETTLRSFNERAERLNKPERYTPQDMMLLVVLGIDKIEAYW